MSKLMQEVIALILDIFLVAFGFAISELKDYLARGRERKAQEKARQVLLAEAASFYEARRREEGEKLNFPEKAREVASYLGGETALWIFHPKQKEVILTAGVVFWSAFGKDIVNAIDGEWAICRYFFNDAGEEALNTRERAALELMSRIVRLEGFWRSKRYSAGFPRQKVQEISLCFGEKYVPCSKEDVESVAQAIYELKKKREGKTT